MDEKSEQGNVSEVQEASGPAEASGMSQQSMLHQRDGVDYDPLDVLPWEIRWRVEELQEDVDRFYYDIPITLQESPEKQDQCLGLLLQAERLLSGRPLLREHIMESRQALVKVEIELNRVRAQDASQSPQPLSRRERQAAERLQQDIANLYDDIATKLQASPDIQTRCSDYLLQAHQCLNRRPLQGKDIAESRQIMMKVQSALIRAGYRRKSYIIVGILFAIAIVLVSVTLAAGVADIFAGPAELNRQLWIGVPLPVWIWAVVGSLTSMLVRAGQFPFADLNEAFRWLLFRLIVGIVMGVFAYLVVIAGLFVFGGISQSQAPELIWIIAFVGGFSDTLSINLLQGILGRFRPVQTPTRDTEQEQGGDQASKA